MHPTLPLLETGRFPAVRRARLETLQVNLGYRCNQSCLHCHVNAGPTRTEQMDDSTIESVLDFLTAVIASLPCYTPELVDRQRGKGVYEISIRALRKLNALGYGDADSGLVLNLVYNPQGPSLPPPQAQLEADYRRILGEGHGIRFNRLLTLANMPIARFGSMLASKGQFNAYMKLLRDSHRDENLEQVMCRSLISVDWRGNVYDCDFNQMLGLPLHLSGKPRPRLTDLIGRDLDNNSVVVRDHCFGCTAGQGSSCAGALNGV